MSDPTENLIDKDAERSALSCIMRGNAGVRGEAERRLRPSFFAHFRAIADVVWDCLRDGLRPDPATVESEGVDPTPITAERVVTQNYPRFYERVREAHKRREIVKAADRAIQAAMHTEGDVLGDLESDLIGISQEMDRARVRSMSDLMAAVMQRWEEGDTQGVPTPFSYLNKLTGGYQDSDLIISCARPSQGKTARAIQEALHCAKHHGPAAFISLEMTDESLAERCLAMEARINSREPMGPEDWQRATKHAGQLSETGLHIVDAPGHSVPQIRGTLRRLYHEHGITAAWIDYLNQIPEPNNNRSRSQNYGIMTRELRNTARELEIPIILLHQLNRGVENRTPERPRASDLRGSGEIEENADVIIAQWMPSKYGHTHLPDLGPSDRGGRVEGLCEIIVDKQRKGPVGSFWLEFTPEHTRFSDLTQKQEHPPIESYANESPF